jgi:hypothetical protein
MLAWLPSFFRGQVHIPSYIVFNKNPTKNTFFVLDIEIEGPKVTTNNYKKILQILQHSHTYDLIR